MFDDSADASPPPPDLSSGGDDVKSILAALERLQGQAMPPPTVPMDIPQPTLAPQKPMSTMGAILSSVLPALATAYSLKKGTGLGSFTGSYLDSQKQFADEEDKRQQRQLQQDTARRGVAQQLREEARQRRLEVNDQQKGLMERLKAVQLAKQQQATREHSLMKNALDEAAKNPSFMSKVNSEGAEKFSLNIEGLGPVNLAQAFQRLGVIKGADGQYSYGAVEPDSYVDYSEEDPKTGQTTTTRMKNSEAVKKGPHITHAPAPATPDHFSTTDAEGGEYRGTIDPTTKAVTKVKVGQRPKKADKTAAAKTKDIKDDDPSSETFGKTFRLTLDDNGNVTKRTLLSATDSTAPAKGNDPAGIR